MNRRSTLHALAAVATAALARPAFSQTSKIVFGYTAVTDFASKDQRQNMRDELKREHARRSAHALALIAETLGVRHVLHSAAPDLEATFLDALPASIDDKVALVRDAAGDRWEALELHAWVSLSRITDRPRELVAGLAAHTGADPDDALASPIVLAGSEREVIDRLRERRERWGYSYVCLQQSSTEPFAPVVAALAGT